jgi:beta-1,4-mannosyltransferase
MAVIVIYKGM